MINYYPYFISSLPMLHFGAKPPFSFEKFLDLTQPFITASELALLKGLGNIEDNEKQVPETVKQWQSFQAGLRNELVKIRAGRKHIDPQRYLRQAGYVEIRTVHVAASASRATSILEAERLLDQEKWRKLDELERGHYFDLDFLIVYVLKLLILNRWERIYTAGNQKLLEEVLEKTEV